MKIFGHHRPRTNLYISFVHQTNKMKCVLWKKCTLEISSASQKQKNNKKEALETDSVEFDVV